MSNKKPSGLGARVRELRERYGWSQMDLAAQLPGVKQQSVDQLENGKVARPRFLPELAIALRTSVQWLLTGDGAPSKTESHADMAIDTILLRDVMTAVEKVMEQQKIKIDHKHRAEMIAALYDIMRHEEKSSPEKMHQAASNIITYSKFLKRTGA